ncbi:hypothetical protein ILUMI_01427 [Ignelater luminosus]|uniref:Uncharacterized protein n=1 Tax=Ignelater luminosus TaxID=2038154 RepID=A0A8K0DFD6_IGNLU|nr:hypothetical protein ILUMI_01427 [Ignelater luminosus]
MKHLTTLVKTPKDPEYTLNLRQALAFIPTEDVVMSFKQVTNADFFKCKELEDFINYFKGTWIHVRKEMAIEEDQDIFTPCGMCMMQLSKGFHELPKPWKGSIKLEQVKTEALIKKALAGGEPMQPRLVHWKKLDRFFYLKTVKTEQDNDKSDDEHEANLNTNLIQVHIRLEDASPSKSSALQLKPKIDSFESQVGKVKTQMQHKY